MRKGDEEEEPIQQEDEPRVPNESSMPIDLEDSIPFIPEPGLDLSEIEPETESVLSRCLPTLKSCTCSRMVAKLDDENTNAKMTCRKCISQCVRETLTEEQASTAREMLQRCSRERDILR